MNSKKIFWLRAVKIAALLLPAILLISLMPVNDYDDALIIRGYYLEEEDSLDMVLIGSSENYAGYNPILAYEEFGFTSYPYVLSGYSFALFEGQLEEALRVQSPQVVVVDIAEIVNVREDADTIFRQFVAGIPFSANKIRLIRRYGNSDDFLSYLFPFMVNHGKSSPQQLLDYWKLNRAIDTRGYTLLKGTRTFTGSGENWDGPYVTPINTTGDHSTAPLPAEVENYCQLVLDACKKYPDVTFLFINYPHRITTEPRYEAYQRTNTVGALLQAGGYDFINLESMLDQIGLVPETDFYNNSHLNLYGQYKVTRFLSRILTEDYGLAGRPLSAQTQENWDTCVQYQHKYAQFFEEAFQSRAPEEFGLWLKEDLWLLTHLPESP